ncbi:MAG: arginase family protein [Actinomycetota bacterium]|nr:arginase family protein [Actinomycetota bacterium]
MFPAAVGAVAGLGERSPGVVWLDAHPDFSAPETSDWGYLDAMGLSMLTGGAWQGVLAGVEGFRPLPETAAVLAGARDFDPSEEVRLDASAVNWLPPERVRTTVPLLQAVDALEPRATGLYLHVDLDVLDADEATVNIYSAPDGLDAAQLGAVVGAVMDAHPVRALSLTAYDPECDADGRVPPIALRLLELTASHLRDARPPR